MKNNKTSASDSVDRIRNYIWQECKQRRLVALPALHGIAKLKANSRAKQKKWTPRQTYQRLATASSRHTIATSTAKEMEKLDETQKNNIHRDIGSIFGMWLTFLPSRYFTFPSTTVVASAMMVPCSPRSLQIKRRLWLVDSQCKSSWLEGSEFFARRWRGLFDFTVLLLSFTPKET